MQSLAVCYRANSYRRRGCNGARDVPDAAVRQDGSTRNQRTCEVMRVFAHHAARPLWPLIAFLPMFCLGLALLGHSFRERARARAQPPSPPTRRQDVRNAVRDYGSGSEFVND